MDHKIQGWSYITSREINRLKRAASRTEQCLLAQEDERLHHEFTSHEAAKRQAEFTDDLRFIHEISVYGMQRYKIPSPTDQIDGRLTWEVYLGAARGFLAKFPQSYTSTVFSLFGLEGMRQKILSYVHECESHLPAWYRVMKDISLHQQIFERAENDMCAYKKPDYQLLRSYTMYKTWLFDDSFENFARAYSETCQSAVTIFIEGPIQLYLMIAEDHMQLIIKALTIEKLTDLFSSKDIADMMHLGTYVERGVQNSRLIPIGISFAKMLTDEYLKDWKEDMGDLRNQYNSMEKRNRFIHAFEQGLFFAS
ncbi:MAG: hypothetical protein Q8R30_05965 [bacterium]|nr:hypothetical protein [bacterium]MDZ4285989.1 hypothetical protein [Candidatus Sungbacteria bacterium]